MDYIRKIIKLCDRIIILVFIPFLIGVVSCIATGAQADAIEEVPIIPTDQEVAATLAKPVVTAESKPTGEVVLTWKEVKNADGYTVMRRKADGTEYTTLWFGLFHPTYVDDEAKPGTKYVYKVLPEYGEAVGPESKEIKADSFTLKIHTPYAAMYPGKSVTPKVHYRVADRLKFTSHDPKVATVSKSGRISGKKIGMTTVTVSYGDYSLDIEVLVGGKAIDVSHWDNTINWSRVKSSGVTAAILKCTQGTTMKDVKFEYNYKNGRKAGIKMGAYCFSVAKSVRQARAEARYILRVLHGRKLQYPIVMDFESNDVVKATTKSIRTKMVLAFKKVVEKAGYQFALYTSPSFIYNYFLGDRLADVYLWLARYNGGKTYCEYTGPGKVMMWQWGGSKVNGIGGSTDTNYIYPGVYKE